MKQAILGDEQKLYIDGTEIMGVQSINGGYSIGETPINILGYGHVDFGFNYFGKPESELDYSSISQNLITEGGLDIDSEQNIGVITEGDNPFEEPGEDFDYRRNNPFIYVNNYGFLVQPFKSMAVINSPLEGAFSINSLLISKDFMVSYVGDNPFSGSIHFKDRYFGFYNGYVTRHTVSCAVGSLPTLSTEIRVFGDIGGSPESFKIDNSEDSFDFDTEDSKSSSTGLSAEGDGVFPEIKIPSHGSIFLRIGGAEIDRVMSFEHSINVDLEPIYIVGSYEPIQVDVRWPTSSTTSFSIEVDEYRYRRLRDYLYKPTLHDLAIEVKDCTGNKVQNYTVVQARLASEQIQSSVEGRLTVNLTYNSYYNRRR